MLAAFAVVLAVSAGIALLVVHIPTRDRFLAFGIAIAIGLVIAFFQFLPERFNKALELNQFLGEKYLAKESAAPKIVALVAFGVLASILLAIGVQKSPDVENQVESSEGQ